MKPTFPELLERYEQLPNAKEFLRVPAWKVLLDEQRTILQLARAVVEADPSLEAARTTEKVRNPYWQQFGSFRERRASEFDLHNIICFNHLPAVVRHREQIARVMGAHAALRTGSAERAEAVYYAVQNELQHSLYHNALWRRYGRQVYVIDPTLLDLLLATPLPDFRSDTVPFPAHSFYLRLPHGVWSLTSRDPLSDLAEPAPIEGIYVSVDEPQPDSPRCRELAMLVLSETGYTTPKCQYGIEDRNMAYTTFGIGPDALVSQVHTIIDGPFATGNRVLARDLPHLVWGLLLYLSSQHPDVEPVQPAKVRRFTEIRSPKQREVALKREAERQKGETRLGFLRVGAKVGERVRSQEAREASSGRKLDHRILVRGHWREQAHGEGRRLRRRMWIEPFWKGPDMAESLEVRAQRIQRAQRKHGEEV